MLQLGAETMLDGVLEMISFSNKLGIRIATQIQ